MYEYYTDIFSEKSGGDGEDWPLVIEADDVINNREVVARLAELMRFDVSKLKFSWEALNVKQVEQVDPLWKIMLSSLNSSNGVLAEKASTNAKIDIDVEAKKWREEFGEVRAAAVERLVKEAMPDYEVFEEQKTTAKG